MNIPTLLFGYDTLARGQYRSSCLHGSFSSKKAASFFSAKRATEDSLWPWHKTKHQVKRPWGEEGVWSQSSCKNNSMKWLATRCVCSIVGAGNNDIENVEDSASCHSMERRKEEGMFCQPWLCTNYIFLVWSRVWSVSVGYPLPVQCTGT